MPVKVETKDVAVSKPINWEKVKYPCIGISNDGDSTVVLFNDYEKGTVIHPGSDTAFKTGHISTSWNMEYFDRAATSKHFSLSNA